MNVPTLKQSYGWSALESMGCVQPMKPQPSVMQTKLSTNNTRVPDGAIMHQFGEGFFVARGGEWVSETVDRVKEIR